jgi:DNA-binding LacI/PurR family transcriptional regulator
VATATLGAAGRPVVVDLLAPAEQYSRRDGAEAMRALLALHEPPDAVFCLNDLLAVGALRAAAEQGRRVPADLAVVGFDGSEEGAYTTPTLTTIVTDKAAMAEAAVERLVHRIVGDPEVNARKITIGFLLEMRESTACGATSGWYHRS